MMIIRLTVWAVSAVLFAGVTSAAAADASCHITFRVGSTTLMSVVLAYPNYADAPGEFEGERTLVQCEALNDHEVAIDDVDLDRTLSIQVHGPGFNIEGPVDVLRCTWLPVGRFPVADDFDLSNQIGYVEGFFVNPSFEISNIECSGTFETTTTSTTNTTISDTTTTTTSSVTTSTTTLPPAECGDYDGSGAIGVPDALGVLRASVGVVDCPLCICDVNGNGSSSVTDALLTLRLSVGLDVTLSCSDC